MKSIAVLVASSLAAFGFAADPLPRAKPEEVGMSSPRLARIGEAVQAEVDAGRIPGAVVAIARRGKLVYYEAFGYRDRERGVPMTLDAIFAPASMEKPMVAVATLQLVERGTVAMADTVEKYLPQLANMKVAVMSADGKHIAGTEPQRRKMTVHDLLRHTAGLTYGRRGDSELYKMYPPSSNIAAETMTAEEFLARLSKLPLHYQPGTKWDYSFAYDVLGLLIESVTHKPLEEVMHASLFEPLGMVDTAFMIAPGQAERYALPLARNPETGERQHVRDVRKRPKFECGGGCASYTAADYLRFAQMLLNGGTLDGKRVLSRKFVEYMTSNHLDAHVDTRELRDYPNIDGYGFGLGVAVRSGYGISDFVGSPGDFHWAGANGTHFWVDPHEQLAVVYMANTPGAIRFRSRQVINALVTQAIDD